MVVYMAYGAARASALAACAAGALALFLGTAQAQQSNRSLAQVERDRSAANARAERLRREAAAAQRDVSELDTRLTASGTRRTETQAAAADANARAWALQIALAAHAARQRRERDAFEAALIAAALSERRAEPRSVRAGILARSAAPSLHQRLRRTDAALADGRRLEDAIGEERRLLVDAQAAIDAERAEIVTLLERRRETQRTLVADAGAAERRARQFAREARSLRELAQRVARAPRNNAGNSGPDIIPAAWLAPAQGRITRAFGSAVAGGPAAQGIGLRTGAGADVIAPAAGEVAYAGLFRSYGQVLILNVDGGYALVFTGLDAMRARAGETVRAGQIIGEMAASDTTAPELYVEVRRDGRPINPTRWLSARGLTAEQQGGRSG
ncbi:MAG: murein hydrolase activator EnvC [Hyphomonadaceae bacterium]